MSQCYIDDVTGEIIERGRSFRLQGPDGGYRDGGVIDVQDPDQLLAIVRDQITSERSSPPFEVKVQTWQHSPLPTAYRKYAPEPEPEPEQIPEDDAPFNEIRSFKVPPFPSLGGYTLPLPPEMRVPSYFSRPSQYEFLTNPPKRSQEEIDAADDRLRKRRRQYAEALAAFCGCKDVTEHERGLK